MTRRHHPPRRRLPVMARLKHALSLPDLSDEVMGDWDCARARRQQARI